MPNEKICIEHAEHCIGLDYKSPYTRHDKKFYKPWRNYFCTTPNDIIWCVLEREGYAEHGSIYHDSNYCNFWLTRSGLDWLGEKIGVTIYDGR